MTKNLSLCNLRIVSASRMLGCRRAVKCPDEFSVEITVNGVAGAQFPRGPSKPDAALRPAPEHTEQKSVLVDDLTLTQPTNHQLVERCIAAEMHLSTVEQSICRHMYLGKHSRSPPLSASAWCRSVFLHGKSKIKAQNCSNYSSCVPRSSCLLLSLPSFRRMKSFVIHKVGFCIFHFPSLKTKGEYKERGIQRNPSFSVLLACFVCLRGQKIVRDRKEPPQMANPARAFWLSSDLAMGKRGRGPVLQAPSH